MEVQNGIFSRDSKGTGQCKNQAWHEEGEGEGGGEKEEWEKKTVSKKKWIKERKAREEIRVDESQVTTLKAIIRNWFLKIQW